MKRHTKALALYLAAPLVLAITSADGQSSIEGFTAATTISESDLVWAVDVSEAYPNDRKTTFEQIVSPFAAAPTTNASFSAATWSAALAATTAPVWANVTATPTTLTGYGITDAATAAQGALAGTAVQSADLAAFPADIVPDLAASRSLGSISTSWQAVHADNLYGLNIASPAFNFEFYDTTLTRSAAGVLAVEGVDVLTTATGATAAQGALAGTAVQPSTAPILDATNFTNLPSTGLQSADLDTFAELDALVADQTLLNTATGYTQAAAAAAFHPLGAVAPVNAQDYDGQRMHRLPVLSVPAPTHANLVHYWPLNSLTDLAGSADFVLGSGALSFAQTSNGYGLDLPTGAAELTATVTDVDWSASWTIWLRVKITDMAPNSAFITIGNGASGRVLQVRYQAGNFAVWYSDDGLPPYTTLTSSGRGQSYGLAEHTLQIVHNATASTLTTTINGNEVLTASTVTIFDNATDLILLTSAVTATVVDEFYVFNAAITDLAATAPAIWNDGRGYSVDLDLARTDPLSISGTVNDEVILLFGQSNLLWNNAGFTNIQDYNYPEFGARMAYTEGASVEDDLIPVGPYPRGITDVAGVGTTGASAGLEIGYAQALLERGFTNPTFLRYCAGGSGLAAGSSPSTGDWSASGTMWTGALAWVNARIAAHSLTSPTRLVWFQGEQDATIQSAADDYETNLLALIVRARAAWGASLPVTLCLPWDQNEDRAYIGQVRAAMLSIAVGDPYVDVIETKYLRRRDDVHVTAQGHLSLGRACAAFHVYPRMF